MANANQVIVNGETILDLRSDTVTPATLKKGETAHDASGASIVGTMESAAPNLQSKSVNYTSNGTATVTPDAGYDGLSSVDVTVNVSGGGGGENETCFITFEGHLPAGSFIAFTTLMPTPLDGDVIMPEINHFTEDFSDMVDIMVLKNSAFYMSGINEGYETKGSIVAGYGNADQNGYYSFLVTGDCHIRVW